MVLRVHSSVSGVQILVCGVQVLGPSVAGLGFGVYLKSQAVLGHVHAFPVVVRFFFFLLLLSILELSDTTIYEPYIRALLGTASRFCEAVVVRCMQQTTHLAFQANKVGFT